jgi:arsenate reductase-like glutaredoxin family protein
VKVAETQDARGGTEAAAALRLARSMKQVVATRGRAVVRLDAAKASDEKLRSAILGPTKRLRAPAIRVGRVLVVGFTEELYRELLRLK